MLSLDRWAVARAHQLQQQIIDAYRDYNFHIIYQRLHNFCAVDLGGFYLDIIKDRQYTTQADSVARRSAQTALFHIAEAMCRWLAPILSFTADEIWQFMPGKRGESVQLEGWYTRLFELDPDEAMNMDFWQQVLETRSAVSKQLENLRVDNRIGSSLDAEVSLYCDGELRQNLDRLGDELRFVMITSGARVNPLDERPDSAIEARLANGNTLYIDAGASSHEKCVRCWHHRADVGSDESHPDLCGRCVENVSGDGEPRHFA
jgi:isoleucyl-tRNA synthetase